MMLTIGTKTFNSRLLLGTGKYPSFDVQKEAVRVSESEILTFAVRRMNIFEPITTELPGTTRSFTLYIAAQYSGCKNSGRSGPNRETGESVRTLRHGES